MLNRLTFWQAKNAISLSNHSPTAQIVLLYEITATALKKEEALAPALGQYIFCSLSGIFGGINKIG